MQIEKTRFRVSVTTNYCINTNKLVKHTDGFKHSNVLDIVAERLRRWTANPLGSPRVGSNPIDVVLDIKRKEPMPIENLFDLNKIPVDLRCSSILNMIIIMAEHHFVRLFWFAPSHNLPQPGLIDCPS